MQTLGFVILRHVNSERVLLYWRKSYECVRKFYPECPIMIIDDNSDQQYIDDTGLTNTTVVQSEFPGRGEVLPYYYYFKNKIADCAVFIHDSVFLNKRTDFFTNTYKKLWDFNHIADQPEDELRILYSINNLKLMQLHSNKNMWRGCFGGMCAINHNFLNFLHNTYDFSIILDNVTTRYHRMSFERVIACILQSHSPGETIFGDIHQYLQKNNIPWATNYEDMLTKHKTNASKMPIIKVWSGR